MGARLKGKLARGRTYERQVGAHLQALCDGDFGGDLYLGPWIRYRDSNGEGLAQPDAFIDFPDHVILIECKLKQSALARQQLERLYEPLLSYILRKRIITVEVFKYPSQGHNAAWIRDLNCLAKRKTSGLWSWHWLK